MAQGAMAVYTWCMLVYEIQNQLGLQSATPVADNINLTGAYTSDLLSDVMAHAEENQALVTIQAHKNTVAVASLIGMPAIIVCNNRPIPPDMVDAAVSEQIAILVSLENQYTVSGKLFCLFNAKG